MGGIDPWVSVAPATTPDAILGKLPMSRGTVTYRIPTSVVPANASGVLVFAWCVTTGANPGAGYWHVAVNLAGGQQNWFSLMVVGSPHDVPARSYNSQAFWLPMPVDGALQVTLAGTDLPAPHNDGEVEIHGYFPGAT